MSSAFRPKPEITVDQYLVYERSSPERHEFLDGELYGMAGESLAHGIISSNSLISLGLQLRGTPCVALTKDTKVRSGPTPMRGDSLKGLFSYPDIVVVCGEPECHDSHRDIILNPTAILEVLSPSTESFDRGEKLTHYQTWNPTLKDYLLISQDEPKIEHHFRQADGTWDKREHKGLNAVVQIASIQCALKLADVYERIAFPKS
jgi:Uma2 family endonuclease